METQVKLKPARFLDMEETHQYVELQTFEGVTSEKSLLPKALSYEKVLLPPPGLNGLYIHTCPDIKRQPRPRDAILKSLNYNS